MSELTTKADDLAQRLSTKESDFYYLKDMPLIIKTLLELSARVKTFERSKIKE